MKLGEEDWEWFLRLENQEQYNKVMNFLNKFPSDWNMRFAVHKNFLERFDEAEKELREQMQKEHEARKEEAQEEEQEKKSELSK